MNKWVFGVIGVAVGFGLGCWFKKKKEIAKIAGRLSEDIEFEVSKSSKYQKTRSPVRYGGK